MSDPERVRSRDGVIYFVGYDNYVKIGFSTNPKTRVDDLQTGAPKPLKTYLILKGTLEDERRHHEMFAAHRLNGEWFRYSDEIKKFVWDNRPRSPSRPPRRLSV
jgi:hypothetical protein